MFIPFLFITLTDFAERTLFNVNTPSSSLSFGGLNGASMICSALNIAFLDCYIFTVAGYCGGCRVEQY